MRPTPEQKTALLRRMKSKAAEIAAASEVGTEPEVLEALDWALSFTDIGTEFFTVERTAGGELEVVVQLTTGVVYDDPSTGAPVVADRVRLRRPKMSDDWRKEPLALSVSDAPSQTLVDLALVSLCVVHWEKLPMPRLGEHLATLTRHDGARLINALEAMEQRAELEARAGKLKAPIAPPSS